MADGLVTDDVDINITCDVSNNYCSAGIGFLGFGLRWSSDECQPNNNNKKNNKMCTHMSCTDKRLRLETK